MPGAARSGERRLLIVRRVSLLALPLVLFACAGTVAQEPKAQPEPQDDRVSEFGRYEGYSVERFDGWETTSRYVEMRDGVKLAVDVTRPTKDGVVTDEPLPVIWTHSRYHRNPRVVIQMISGMDEPAPVESNVDIFSGLQVLVRHGYVIAAAGVRGSGASFGRFEGLFSDAETKDAAELTEWFAAQPWCDGNVGMWGGSYLGITQYMNASLAPPALKAIFPDVAAFDMYDVIYPGGAYRSDMMNHWAGLTQSLDTEWPAPRVDGDDDGALLEAAMAEHVDNWDVMGEYGAGPVRDHDSPGLTWMEHGPSARLAAINAAKVPAHHINGWYDVFATDVTLWFANYAGPQKLTIGAWSHGALPDGSAMRERERVTAVEQHRWFDRWLKGIENGVENDPPVQYALMDELGEWSWRSAETWPVPEAEPVEFFFDADGALATAAPREAGHDAYEIDPTTTTGAMSRWDNAVGAAQFMVYPDMSANDAKSLTWTTAPLEEDTSVVGHPVVTLYVTCEADDTNLHVLLEEVNDEGVSRYVTEGVVRGSLRKRSQAPWNNLGLPYQRCFEEDREPLPRDEPTEVVLDLHPTATLFNKGHRIRIALMGADADNTETVPGAAGATLNVFRGGARASGIVLPVAR